MRFRCWRVRGEKGSRGLAVLVLFPQLEHVVLLIDRSRRQKNDNMMKVFLEICKEPSSFSELLEKTGLSRPVLSNHLKFLEKNLAICPDTIKRNETLKPQDRSSEEIAESK